MRAPLPVASEWLAVDLEVNVTLLSDRTVDNASLVMLAIDSCSEPNQNLKFQENRFPLRNIAGFKVLRLEEDFSLSII